MARDAVLGARAWFMRGNALAAAGLVLIFAFVDRYELAPFVYGIAAISAVGAAVLSAWGISRWYGRRAGRSPSGMAFLVTLLTFLLFLILSWVCLMVLVLFDKWTGGNGLSWRSVFVDTLIISFFSALVGVVVAGLPAWVIQYFLCRRFLKKTAMAGVMQAHA